MTSSTPESHVWFVKCPAIMLTDEQRVEHDEQFTAIGRLLTSMIATSGVSEVQTTINGWRCLGPSDLDKKIAFRLPSPWTVQSAPRRTAVVLPTAPLMPATSPLMAFAMEPGLAAASEVLQAIAERLVTLGWRETQKPSLRLSPDQPGFELLSALSAAVVTILGRSNDHDGGRFTIIVRNSVAVSDIYVVDSGLPVNDRVLGQVVEALS